VDVVLVRGAVVEIGAVVTGADVEVVAVVGVVVLVPQAVRSKPIITRNATGIRNFFMKPPLLL
jgi:hypothetical protein